MREILSGPIRLTAFYRCVVPGLAMWLVLAKLSDLIIVAIMYNADNLSITADIEYMAKLAVWQRV